MKRILGITFSLWMSALMAQSPKTLSEIERLYPFLKAQNALLTHYGDASAAKHFFDKYEQLNLCGDEQIAVAHFGGSHVQAGTLSRRMQKNLQSLNPNHTGAPGFFFPFHLAKTNNPAHYYSESNAPFTSIRAAKPSDMGRWGMSAITVYTHDSSGYVMVKGMGDDKANWVFDKVRIFTPLGDSCFSLKLDSAYNVLDKNIDSAAGMVEWTLDTLYHSLTFHWEKTDSLQQVLYLDGIQLLNSRPGITYHGMGANGNSTGSLVRSEAMPHQIKYLDADLAIFGIGINDAHKSQSAFNVEEYKRNYREVLDELRAHNPNTAFIFMTNNDSYYKGIPNPNAKRVQIAMRQLAEEYGGWVFDLFNYMGGMNASQVWFQHGLGKRDKIHFTEEGYLLHADALYQSVKLSFFDFLKNKYPKPLIP